ncbi:MAG: DUF4403 family protein [Spirosomaceae bacterium]|nr:DUF4403 family protein [Spirosomataceae bacterium]
MNCQKHSSISHILSCAAVVLSLPMLFWGCQPTGTSTQPKAPAAAYLHTQMDIQNEKHRSVVNIPIELSVADVAKQLNTQVQGLIYEDGSFEDNKDNFKAKVWKRAPITVEARDSLLYYTVPLKVWAEKAYTVMGISGSQATEFQINLKFLTRFGIEPNWQVSTQTASAGFEWVTKPSIKVAGIEIPITGIVSSKISENLGSISQAIDQSIRKGFLIKPYVVQAWNLIREPRMLSEEFRTWLVVTPSDILMSPFDIKNGKIRATIGVRGFTQTYTGEKPVFEPVADIPNLIISDQIPKGFQIGIIGTLPYEEASKLAGQQFVGKKFDFQNGKYQIEVTEVDIYGQNEKMVIKAGLKGSINGTIYLKGIPYFNATDNTVALKNLDYDLSTRNTLVKTANWLLQGTFAKRMEQQFVFSVAEQVTEMQKAIKQQLVSRKITKSTP